MNKLLKLLEVKITKNITIISIIIFAILSSLFLTNCISLNYYLTYIWWLFAFWYWYKKYERNKDIEMLDKYLIWEFSIKSDLDDIKRWKIAYNLFNMWYISEDVWNIIEEENKTKLIEYIYENLNKELQSNFIERLSQFLLGEKVFKEYMLNHIKEEIDWMNKYINNKRISTELKKDFKIYKGKLEILLHSIEEWYNSHLNN